MIEPVFAAYMLCAKVDFHNRTQKWTDNDVAVMTQIQEKGCREKFPDEPCLKSFEKLGENEYNAVCGPPQPLKED
jgi:hypothetical protein